MTEMLTLDAFEEASAKVQEVTQKTGLIESPHFSAQTGNKVFFKPENMQRTGAYKVRGAYYKISTLTDEERERGLITASAQPCAARRFRRKPLWRQGNHRHAHHDPAHQG